MKAFTYLPFLTAISLAFPISSVEEYFESEFEGSLTADDNYGSYTPVTSAFASAASSAVATPASSYNTLTTSTGSATSTSSSSSSTASGTYTGRGTYYTPSDDACGTSSTSSDLVVAIAQTLYDGLGTNGEEVSTGCGKSITASYQGKSVTVKVVDACESCTNNDLDFSPAAFKQLADLDIGEITINWSWD
ncbi:hypothetical protein PACTADRAFT_47894 [Pachysolen tannophilus NRRL Y-2460]|uniref:RlpA-like protein double-psi beta-barrel domain-containing protein n=1 Tax=Pachysolen tannophilus NRRL Y-2460 TaxID=669874 RepID=A0A1E4U235_PACTA|nr:hypothetical protein PACTADRAFT_47894 [Pachysolen tannophilus NRRL Y-2460]